MDIFKGKSHIDNATKFKVWLAFDCPEFRDTKAREWCELVAGLTEKNVSQRKDSDKETWRKCVHTLQKRVGASGAGTADASGKSSHLPSALVKAGAFGSSVAASGLSAAKLHLQAQGAKFMDAHVDSVTNAELEAVKALQLRWITGKGLPLSACDGALFDELIQALRPALKGKLLNSDKIRHNSLLKKAFTELLGAVNEIKKSVGRFAVQLDGWTDINNEYLINCISTVCADHADEPDARSWACRRGPASRSGWSARRAWRCSWPPSSRAWGCASASARPTTCAPSCRRAPPRTAAPSPRRGRTPPTRSGGWRRWSLPHLV